MTKHFLIKGMEAISFSLCRGSAGDSRGKQQRCSGQSGKITWQGFDDVGYEGRFPVCKLERHAEALQQSLKFFDGEMVQIQPWSTRIVTYEELLGLFMSQPVQRVGIVCRTVQLAGRRRQEAGTFESTTESIDAA